MKTKVLKTIFLALVLMITLSPVMSFANDITITPGADGVTFEVGDQSVKDQAGAWTKISDQVKYVVTGVTAVAVLISVGSLVLGFMQMGTASGNPQKLSQAKTAIMYGVIGLIGIGSVWTIAALALNFL